MQAGADVFSSGATGGSVAGSGSFLDRMLDTLATGSNVWLGLELTDRFTQNPPSSTLPDSGPFSPGASSTADGGAGQPLVVGALLLLVVFVLSRLINS